MGDRCSCSLYVGTTLDAEIFELLSSEFGGPDEAHEDLTWLHYEEVNYGELPQKVKDRLIATKTPFAWWNGAGGTYAEGVVLFDGEDVTDWAMLDGEIMLPVTATKNPDIVAKAQKAQAFWEEL